ncbi:MAG: chemotaxis protein CheB, partial [Ferruginibacter sp.]
TCPECHGTLVSLEEGNILRFRCHTGHAYSDSALLEDVSESVEKMLFQSVRVAEEKAFLEKSIGEHLEKIHHKDAIMFSQKAEKTLERSRLLHDFVFKTFSPQG